MRKSWAKHSQESELSEVNITPLADVSLTLVIMLMILSPMVFQSMIQVQAAQAVATAVHSRVREKPLFVDVSLEGYKVNNEMVLTEYDLYRTLQRGLSRKKGKTVMITAGANVRYQSVVRVLDIVKQSGALSLSLVPRRKRAS